VSWGGAEREKVEVEKSVQGPEPHRAERWLLFLNGPLSLSDSSLVLLLSFIFYLSLVDDNQCVRRELGPGRLDERADGGDLLKKVSGR